MRNLYSTCTRRASLCLIVTLGLIVTSQAQKMVTYDTTFGGWNAIVTEDVSLAGTDSAAGIVFFPGIGQMTTNISDLSVNGPHYLINNGLWDGSVPLGNGVHHPFIISLQPPSSGYPASTVLPKIQAILARYRIKRNSFYMTGLSCGGWQANEFVAYEPTPGDNSAGMMVKAIVNLEGVEPADSTPIYPSESYPRKMGHWAKTCGGRELWVEGSNDWRDMLAGAQNMMDSVPGSASYFQVTYGGGAHCCWNTEYQPSVTWTTASNSNISQVAGAQVPMNVWQWLLRQGDTSMPKGTSAVTTTTATAPTVSAGSGQSITLPASQVALSATAKGNGGASIVSVYWKQSSGPATATIGSSKSLYATATGMTTAGSYVFTFYAVDNNGNSSNASMTVTVNAPALTATVSTPSGTPTVSAGVNQTIVLPASSVTLNGTVTTNGDVISGYNWMLMSGPSFVKLSNEWGVSTAVSQLVQGTYIFKLSISDSKGSVYYSAPVSIVVNAAATAAMRTTAMTGQASFMSDPAASGDSSLSGQVGSMQFYPNPVRDLLNLRLNNSVTGKVFVAVFDLAGMRVVSQELDKQAASLETTLDVSRLTAGVYVIEVISGPNLRTVGKFIKE